MSNSKSYKSTFNDVIKHWTTRNVSKIYLDFEGNGFGEIFFMDESTIRIAQGITITLSFELLTWLISFAFYSR